MVLPVNGARGEVGVTIGDVDIVLAATMGGLAAVSTELGCKSMNDLFDRLSESEVAAAISGLRHLTIRGDADAAIGSLKLSHFPILSQAFHAALSHHFVDEPGNGEAKEKA
ncbi:hypothetical protein [Ochrobactrum soli]|uniref:Uncharacterized protein n=1 Tax=Ochrobactrum soli TaxID=2448455 RepID=A0A2P9HIT4_9HYPH|nr:hypothetical protein [[Ochrobactrum] soli]SPL63710.1 hypothetical protein OHAE_3642 [[Ochrobactrum] soli]